MLVNAKLAAVADRVMAAHDAASMLAPITAGAPDFNVADAYTALAEIERRRRAQGWLTVGRKIGFTNRTIWQRYGVSHPIWAHIWTHTVHFAPGGKTSLSLRAFVQPRIEPEIVFKLKQPVLAAGDPSLVLACVEWIAPGFEIVQSHFPGWKFAAPDCIAASALHAALVVGNAVAITDANRAMFAAALPTFELTLSRGGTEVERGIGSNVLGSPALALAHLAGVLAGQPQFPALAAGEIVTTGTITDAWPVADGEVWSSQYGALGLDGLTLRFCDDA